MSEQHGLGSMSALLSWVFGKMVHTEKCLDWIDSAYRSEASGGVVHVSGQSIELRLRGLSSSRPDTDATKNTAIKLSYVIDSARLRPQLTFGDSFVRLSQHPPHRTTLFAHDLGHSLGHHTICCHDDRAQSATCAVRRLPSTSTFLQTLHLRQPRPVTRRARCTSFRTTEHVGTIS